MSQRLGKFKVLADEPGISWSPWHWRTKRYPNKIYKMDTYELECPDIPNEVLKYRICGLHTKHILETMSHMGFGDDCHEPVLMVAADQRIGWVTGVKKVSTRRPWDNLIIEKWQVSGEPDPEQRITCSELRKVLMTDIRIKVSMSGVTPKPYLSWIGVFENGRSPCLIFGEYTRNGVKKKMRDMEEK